jgi:hypothetical protein
MSMDVVDIGGQTEILEDLEPGPFGIDAVREEHRSEGRVHLLLIQVRIDPRMREPPGGSLAGAEHQMLGIAPA